MKRRSIALGFAVIIAALLASPVPAAEPSPTDADVKALQQRLDALQKQIDEINRAPDAATRQGLVEKNWREMQDYMGSMHGRWGMGTPWMEPGMMGCPAMGGSGAAWPPPAGVDAKQYGEQMRSHMQQMHEQMNAIAGTTDPAERQRLLQQHWDTMYQSMQSMRGMGWMWGGGPMMGRWMMRGVPPPTAKALPEPDSKGAKLVSNYCVQCHAAPSPDLHTKAEWSGVTDRMHAHMTSTALGIRTPSDQEMKAIVAYLEKNAP